MWLQLLYFLEMLPALFPCRRLYLVLNYIKFDRSVIENMGPGGKPKVWRVHVRKNKGKGVTEELAERECGKEVAWVNFCYKEVRVTWCLSLSKWSSPFLLRNGQDPNPYGIAFLYFTLGHSFPISLSLFLFSWF